jgi:hypothetical protein
MPFLHGSVESRVARKNGDLLLTIVVRYSDPPSIDMPVSWLRTKQGRLMETKLSSLLFTTVSSPAAEELAFEGILYSHYIIFTSLQYCPIKVMELSTRAE